MKLKQLQSIQGQFQRHLKLGKRDQPDLAKHVALAITSGEVPKMRPAREIVQVARNKIIENGRYSLGDHALSFENVFLSCNGYAAEMKEWLTYETSRQKKVKAYRKVADPLLRKAELSDAADPEEIAAALEDAAYQAGLLAIAPVATEDES